jgi:hypothetical protein
MALILSASPAGAGHWGTFNDDPSDYPTISFTATTTIDGKTAPWPYYGWDPMPITPDSLGRTGESLSESLTGSESASLTWVPDYPGEAPAQKTALQLWSDFDWCAYATNNNGLDPTTTFTGEGADAFGDEWADCGYFDGLGDYWYSGRSMGTQSPCPDVQPTARAT